MNNDDIDHSVDKLSHTVSERSMPSLRDPDCLDRAGTTFSAVSAIASHSDASGTALAANIVAAGASVLSTLLTKNKTTEEKIDHSLQRFRTDFIKYWQEQYKNESVAADEIESAIASFEHYFNSDATDRLPSPDQIVSLGIDPNRIAGSMLDCAARAFPDLYRPNDALTEFPRSFFLRIVSGGLEILFSDSSFTQDLVQAINRVILETHELASSTNSEVKRIADTQLTKEHFNEFLSEKFDSLQEKLTANSTQSNTDEQLRVELLEVEEKLAARDQAYDETVSRLEGANEALDKMEGQLPSTQITNARAALANGPDEAYRAFEEIVSGKTGATVAEAAYQAAVLAMSAVRLADARKHFDIAVAHETENIQYLKDSGFLEYKYGNFEKSELHFKKALELSKDEHGEEDKITASLRNDLGGIYNNRGKHAEAVIQYEQAFPTFEKNFGPNSYESAIVLANMGDAYRALGNYKTAFPLLRDSLRRCPTHLGGQNLAGAYMGIGQYQRAINTLRNVIEQLVELDANTQLDVINLNGVLLLALVREGIHDQAEALAHELEDECSELLGPEHLTTLYARGNLALSFSERGMHAKSEEVLREIRPLLEKSLGEDHPSVATNLHNLGENLRHQDKLQEAQREIERALKIRRDKLGDRHPDVACSYNSMGLIMKKYDHFGISRQYMKAAVAICSAAIGVSAEQTRIYVDNLVGLLLEDEKHDEAQRIRQTYRRGY